MVEQEEEERLIQQYRVFYELFDGKLFFPPLQYPRRILDCGYGQGNWAVTMAQTYHQSEVSQWTPVWHSWTLKAYHHVVHGPCYQSSGHPDGLTRNIPFISSGDMVVPSAS
jgi:hypothetical protein